MRAGWTTIAVTVTSQTPAEQSAAGPQAEETLANVSQRVAAAAIRITIPMGRIVFLLVFMKMLLTNVPLVTSLPTTSRPLHHPEMIQQRLGIADCQPGRLITTQLHPRAVRFGGLVSPLS